MLKRFLKKPEEIKEVKQECKTYTLKEAAEHVQEQLLEVEEKKDFRNAMSGDYEAYLKALKTIEEFLINEQIAVEGFINYELLAKKIYANLWGLGAVEDDYREPTVDELRVNNPNNIYVVKRGKSHCSNKQIVANEATIEEIVKRMIIHDEGKSIDRSKPIVESVRRDNSRLTGLCPPVSKGWHFVLRKHGTFQMSKENLIASGTLNQEIWDLLQILVRGRANILFSGNPGAGKSSLMRKAVEFMHPSIRIVVIGEDSELNLTEHYPKRDIIELEEQPHIGVTMKTLFRTTLRLGPDCVIVEEFRGAGEAIEAIKACTRGLFGSMASAHFNSPEESVEGTAMMMLEEGLTLPLDLAKLRVAKGFNIVVQMYGDTISGIKKITEITEIVVEGEEIIYSPLIVWKSTGDNYMEDGVWETVNQPSNKLINHMSRTVPRSELEALGWH